MVPVDIDDPWIDSDVLTRVTAALRRGRQEVIAPSGFHAGRARAHVPDVRLAPPPPLPAARPSRRGEVARGLLALATLVVLFGLVPLQLVTIGGAPWRWVAAWPGWPTVRRALVRDGIPESAYPSLLTGVAWLLLAHLALSAGHEVGRVVRQRPPRPDRTGPSRRAGPMPTPAAGVRHLVRSAALLVTTLAPAAPLATPGPAARPVAVVRPARPAPSRAAPPLRVVTRHATAPVVAGRWDTPYSLAVGHLGDGSRRDEIIALNQGRVLPDGSPFRGELQAGFEVLLPAAGPTPPTPPTPPAPAPTDGTAARADDTGRSWELPAAVARSTIVATGMAGLLLARRRRRVRSMRADQALPPTDPDLAPTETAVHHGADALGLARLDLALRSLAGAASPARPQWALRHRDGRLGVGFAATAPAPPAPWSADAAGDRWELPATIGLAELATLAPLGAAPCPALVLLGTVTAGPHRGSELYVDLEAIGVLVLDGTPAQTAALARAMVATLTVSPLADVIELVVVGIDCYGLAHEPRVHHVGTIDDAVSAARALTVGPLATGPLPWTGRPGTGADTWAPAVVIAVRQALHGDHADRLAALARGRAGGGAIAVVTDQRVPDAAWRLHPAGAGRWRVAPLDLELEPCELAADELADLGALLIDAAAPPVAAALPPPSAVARPAFVEPDWTFMVRLLGPVDVVTRHATPVAFARGKALELVAWLGLHRGNATRIGARTALWETDVQHSTFANVVSDARGALARTVTPLDDHGWIARTYDERLPLHPGVVTDVGLLRARLDAARTQPVTTAIATLRPALALVRDLPFSGTSWLWPDAEALPSALTHLVTSAAAHLTHLLLQAGDPEGALWATAQGLRALPGHEELVCLRMRVHASTGDLAGVRHEFQSYERAVANDPFGDGDVAPKVAGVRNELLAVGRDQRLRSAPDAHRVARSSSL